MKTKNAIIDALLNEKGLDLTSINSKLKENHGTKYKYHSVYKVLKQFLEEGTIQKDNELYSLSDSWVSKKVNFSLDLQKHLSNTKGINHNLNDNSLLEFDNIKQLHKFLRNLENEHLPIFDKEKKGTIIFVMYHCYNYLLQPAKELEYIRKLKSDGIDFKILCYGNTPLDNWTKKAFEKFGASMKINAQVGGLSGLNIYDDMVVEIFYGREFLNVLNEVYTNTPTTNDFDLSNLFYKLSKINYKINVALYKDKNIIKSLKERALSFF
jgi:hypothetical protein